MKHLTGNNLLPEWQSAYRPYHSTETALLSIFLLLLDLCAAFDTLDHDNLLERLNNYCRVSGKALDWFASFLSEIAQSIQIASWSSTPLLVPFGVPQESVFEGDLFLELVSTLPAATSVTGVTVDQFFDDTQARVSFKPTSDGSEQQSAFNSLSSWAANANTWYIRNRVKLNPPKSTIIVTNTKRQTSKQSAALPVPPPFSIGGTSVDPSTEAKNLGVIIDNHGFTHPSSVQNILLPHLAHWKNPTFDRHCNNQVSYQCFCPLKNRLRQFALSWTSWWSSGLASASPQRSRPPNDEEQKAREDHSSSQSTQMASRATANRLKSRCNNLSLSQQHCASLPLQASQSVQPRSSNCLFKRSSSP